MHDDGITISQFVSRYIDEIKPLLRSAGTLFPVLLTFAESVPDMPLVHLRGHQFHKNMLLGLDVSLLLRVHSDP